MRGQVGGRIFLSYRREDSRHVAGRLADRLRQQFDRAQVFMDVETIEPGADFAREVAAAVGSCDVLLALIGPRWLAPDRRTGRPRLHEPGDYVALEIRVALERGIRVVPVLVDEAGMPRSAELPESLVALATRNAVRLDHETFSSDVRHLLGAVERILVSSAGSSSTVGGGGTGAGARRGPDRPGLVRPETSPGGRASTRREPPFAGDREARLATVQEKLPIGPLRAAIRIGLWWLIYFMATFMGFGFASVVKDPGAPDASVGVGVLVTMGAIVTGLALLLRKEVRRQRAELVRAGVDWQRAGSPVSVRHVRIVSVICAVVALVFGAAMASAPPPPVPQPVSLAVAPGMFV